MRSSQVRGGEEQESRSAVQDAKVRVVIHSFIHDGLDNDKIYIYIYLPTLVLIKNYGVRRLEATKRYYIGRSPIPELI